MSIFTIIYTCFPLRTQFHVFYLAVTMGCIQIVHHSRYEFEALTA